MTKITKTLHMLVWLLALPLLQLGSGVAFAREQPAAAQADSDYVGSDNCAKCHQDQSKRFNNTPMGKAMAHPRTADEKLGCESCHGPGKAHSDAEKAAEDSNTKDPEAKNLIFDFASKDASAEMLNDRCLTCHSKGNRLFWTGSPHQSRAITCVHCHMSHGPSGENKLSSDVRYSAPLTENLSVKKQQPELCLECHQMRRAQLQRSSHMPYREGKVTCTSCHNPHGTPNPSQLIQSTINETCLSCHTERRGPFLFEHPPVMENCANCHEAHGSNNPQLLKVRMPRVCDSCHVASRHPVTPTVLNSVRDFNRGCTNCHSRIHGSNHPSGKFFFR